MTMAAPVQPAAQPLFPDLLPSAPLAVLPYRQTLALALVPLGTALLLAAALLPETPSAAFLMALSAGLLPTLLFAAIWPGLVHRGRTFPGAGLLHYLLRCVPILLTPALLWMAFHRVLHETAGAWPLVLLASAFVLHPVSRILHEAGSPRLELARLWVRQTEVLLVLLGVLGLLSGAILEAHKDYPTDPTVLLLVLWMLGILLFVATLVLASIQWQTLRAGSVPGIPGQPLDDPPPPGDPSKPCTLDFHSDEF
jgi:hypothetical protein